MADFRIVLAVALTVIKVLQISDADVHSISSSGVLGINPGSKDLLTNIEYTSAVSSPQPLPRSASTSTLFFTSGPSKNAIPTSAPNPTIEPLLPISISISTPSPYSKSTTLRLPSSTHTFNASPSSPLPLSSTLASTPATSTTSELSPLSGSSTTTLPEHTTSYSSSSTISTVKTPKPLHTPKFNLTPDQATVYNLLDVLKLLPAGFRRNSPSSYSTFSPNPFSSPGPTMIPGTASHLITDDNLNSAVLYILSKLSEVNE